MAMFFSYIPDFFYKRVGALKKKRPQWIDGPFSCVLEKNLKSSANNGLSTNQIYILTGCCSMAFFFNQGCETHLLSANRPRTHSSSPCANHIPNKPRPRVIPKK
jgi:hypothetical protein